MIKLLRRAPARFAKSLGYCWNALKVTARNEESFRLEMIAMAILLVVMVLSSWRWWKVFAMMAGFLLIPLVEVVNSAIEDICDLITKERNELVRNAKDKGALAVLIAVLFNAVLLVALLAADD